MIVESRYAGQREGLLQAAYKQIVAGLGVAKKAISLGQPGAGACIMKMNQPLGAAHYGPMIIRLALGAYFILAGMGKLNLLAAFVDQVRSFGVLPGNIAAVYGILLPYVEVSVGALLVIGMWTTLSGVLAGLMILSFVLAFGVFPGTHDIFNKDLILLAAACSLLYSGPGALSIDNIGKQSPA